VSGCVGRSPMAVIITPSHLPALPLLRCIAATTIIDLVTRATLDGFVGAASHLARCVLRPPLS